MHPDTHQIAKNALALPPHERAALAELLLESLDLSNPRMEALWAKESTARYQAHLHGRMPALSAEEVFADLEKDGVP